MAAGEEEAGTKIQLESIFHENEQTYIAKD